MKDNKLLVYIGTFACEVGLKVYESVDGAIDDNVRLLLIDTYDGTFKKASKLGLIERGFYFHCDIEPAVEKLKNLDLNNVYNPASNGEKITFSLSAGGANGEAGKGRIIFASHGEKIYLKLLELRRYFQQLSGPLEITILDSPVSGTGAGFLISTANLLRHMFPSSFLNCIIVLPSFLENKPRPINGNGTASKRIQKEGTCAEVMRTIDGCLSQKSFMRFSENYGRFGEIELKDKIFNRIGLFSGEYGEIGDSEIKSMQDLTDLSALLKNLILEAIADGRDGIWQKSLGEYNNDEVYLCQRKALSKGTFYTSCNLVRVFFDADELRKLLKVGVLVDELRKVKDKPTDSFSPSSILDTVKEAIEDSLQIQITNLREHIMSVNMRPLDIYRRILKKIQNEIQNLTKNCFTNLPNYADQIEDVEEKIVEWEEQLEKMKSESKKLRDKAQNMVELASSRKRRTYSTTVEKNEKKSWIKKRFEGEKQKKKTSRTRLEPPHRLKVAKNLVEAFQLSVEYEIYCEIWAQFKNLIENLSEKRRNPAAELISELENMEETRKKRAFRTPESSRDENLLNEVVYKHYKRRVKMPEYQIEKLLKKLEREPLSYDDIKKELVELADEKIKNIPEPTLKEIVEVVYGSSSAFTKDLIQRSTPCLKLNLMTVPEDCRPERRIILMMTDSSLKNSFISMSNSKGAQLLFEEMRENNGKKTIKILQETVGFPLFAIPDFNDFEESREVLERTLDTDTPFYFNILKEETDSVLPRRNNND